MTPQGIRLTSDEKRSTLTAAQWQIYEAGWNPTARFRVAVCGRRFGKALAAETILPSPDGWITMEDVILGTRLYDEKGRVCYVTFCTDITYKYRCNLIRFLDGSSIIADDDHSWLFKLGKNHVLLSTIEARVYKRIGYELKILNGKPAGLYSSMGVNSVRLYLNTLRQAFRLYAIFLSPSMLKSTNIKRLSIIIAEACDALGIAIIWHKDRLELHRFQNAYKEIKSIKLVGSQSVRCIQVSSTSSLFMCTNRYILTHNTFLMAEELRRAVRLAVKNNISADNEIWYGAPNFLQAKRVMWGRLKRAIPKHWIVGKPNETNCSITVQSGHVVRLVGLESSDTLRGSGLWFFGGDEWSDCRPSAWQEVIRPMLSTAKGHALFIGTPKGFDHFRDAYIRGLPGGDPTYKSFLFTTEDGGNVPLAELAAARKELDQRTYRQEYCASFETYAGRVVYAFNRAVNVQETSYDPLKPVHIGMDFNVNPMSATVWQENGLMVCQIDEIIMPTSNTDEISNEISRRYGRAGFSPLHQHTDHIFIYPDPAGAQRRSSAAGRTDISILREKGFTVIADTSHAPVRDRLNVTNRQFSSADGTILATVDPKCVKSINAYERHVFRDGTNDPDKMSGYDHLVDATGYYLFSRKKERSSLKENRLMER